MFDWQSSLAPVYSRYPEAPMRPVIGISANFSDGCATLARAYYESVERAGGTPVLLPPTDSAETIAAALDRIDGLLLSGGADFNPLYCGEEPSPRLHSICPERDKAELLLTQLAYNRQMPILGICRGIQTLAMALGGKVRQDIADKATVKHSQDAPRSCPTHTVALGEGSIVRSLYDNKERIAVNSFHHQAVAATGDRFRTTATAADGTIEAIESREFRSIIGVQWHPECLADGAPLFRWLVGQARGTMQAAALHRRIITLDTHCDTPMFFAQGADIAKRGATLVDLHKMAEGRQDATIMVAYLPQPKIGQRFSECVPLPAQGPMEYADMVLDRIEAQVESVKQYASIARTPADIVMDKRHGRQSIMLGIENALALEGNAANVEHFAKRGVVYITLCHNGDNDICDSARGCNTHNGVSRIGAKVIGEMNRLGLLVDLSHAAEKSFYDALDISSQPIVCSHSSCRALCDHPRNLTDDQMRKLAAAGGVMQITLYHGFLRKDGEATVLDALQHLEHAIHIMGIDSVGIGTDFDGDGGVRGFASASEAIGFTRQLLARRYSESDIRKIWGGNFLRLMSKVRVNG